MRGIYSSLPVNQVKVDAKQVCGELELWRHSIGHGGVNSLPLPSRVVAGAAKLRPRLVRIFIQEFFNVYRGGGEFDWSKLDPYMTALQGTGARIVAALCIKPKALYPQIDEKGWWPANVGEWQRVVAAMAERYSVQRPLISHWEIGNEVDIGESGGCPYLIKSPEDYAEYYRMTIEPILRVAPQARVGGPANAGYRNEPMRSFVALCRQRKLPLHLLSWHLYSDDPAELGRQTRIVKEWIADWPGEKPELMVTEFAPGFEPVSVEDAAYETRRAGCLAATILDALEAGLDWSFYYHLWDQTCYPEEFAPFFSRVRYMCEHWNDKPHRFGLFGVDGEVRPQFFVYQLLGRMGEQRLAASREGQDLRVLAARGGDDLSVLLVNYGMSSMDRIIDVRWEHLEPGVRTLTVYRIDDQRRWCPQTLEIQPLETRVVGTLEDYHCQVRLPPGSVALVRLAKSKE